MQKNIFCFLLLIIGTLGCQSDDVITVSEPKADDEVVTTSKPKLDYYVESYDLPDLGFVPEYKMTYEYNSSGRLSRYRVFTYDPNSKSTVEQRHFDFSYSDSLVTKIVGTPADAAAPNVYYAYEYFSDGRVFKIKETNKASGINAEVTFAYNDSEKSTKVSYTFSNGGSFQYEFHVQDGNILNDKTTRGAQLCSNGQYSYDDHINPFAMLGYTDYLLVNMSVNNKVSENINHVNCSFPTFIPETYSYEYNDQGYPTVMTTFFKTGSGIKKSRREIFYK